MSQFQDELNIKVVATDAGVHSVLTGVGTDFGHVGLAAHEAGEKGQGAFGRIKEGATAFLAAGLIQNVTASLGGMFGDTISKAGDFAAKMSEIKATSGATGAELASLRQTALNLGMATDVGSVSAKDAAQAIFELGKAGVAVDAINAGVAKSTLQLAAAAGPEFGVANSAALAADSMNTFGLSAKDSTAIVNGLVGAANASSIGLSDLKFSLSAVGPVAHQVGMTMQDFDVAMAEFGLHGLKGSDAGTSLKTMLLNLQPSTKAATAEFKALGLVTADGTNLFYDQSGHLKSLADVQDILKTHTAGLNAAQQQMAFKTMFGTDAIRAAAIMTGEGKQGALDMAAAVLKQGDAATAAATMSDNYKGKIDALAGTLETMQIAVGSLLLPTLGAGADMINTLAGDLLGAMNGTTAWADVLPHLQTGWAHLISTILPTTGPLAGVGDFLKNNFQVVLVGVAGVLTAIVIPALVAFVVPLLAAAAPLVAVGLAVGALYLAWQSNFGGMRDVLQGAWGAIAPVFTAIGGAVSTLTQAFSATGLQGVWAALPGALAPVVSALAAFGGQLLTQIGTWAGMFVAWIAPMIPPALAALGTALGQLVAWAGAQLPVWGAQLATWATAFVAWVGPMIPPVLAVLGTFVGHVLGWLGAQVPPLVAQLLVWGRALVDWIGPQIPPLLQEAARLGGELFTWIANQVGPLVGKLGEWAGAFVAWVGPRIPPLLAELGRLAGQMGGWLIHTALPALVHTLGEWGRAFVAWIGPQIGPMLGALAGFVGEMGGWVLGTGIPLLVGFLAGMAVKLVIWIANAVPAMLTGIASFFGSLFTNVTTVQGPAANQSFLEAAGSMIGGIVGGLAAGAGAVWSAISNVATHLLDGFKAGMGINSPSTQMLALAGHIIEGLINGIRDGFGKVVQVAHDLAMQIPEPIRTALGIKSPSRVLFDVGVEVPAGLVGGIMSGTGAVTAAVTGLTGGINWDTMATDPAPRRAGQAVITNFSGGIAAGVAGMAQVTAILNHQDTSSSSAITGINWDTLAQDPAPRRAGQAVITNLGAGMAAATPQVTAVATTVGVVGQQISDGLAAWPATWDPAFTAIRAAWDAVFGLGPGTLAYQIVGHSDRSMLVAMEATMGSQMPVVFGEGGPIGRSLRLAEDVFGNHLTALITSVRTGGHDIGVSFGEGLVAGISSQVGAIAAAAAAAVTAAIAAARTAADSRSPSRKMQAVGVEMGQGQAIGLASQIPDQVLAGSALARASIEAARATHQEYTKVHTPPRFHGGPIFAPPALHGGPTFEGPPALHGGPIFAPPALHHGGPATHHNTFHFYGQHTPDEAHRLGFAAAQGYSEGLAFRQSQRKREAA